MIFSLKLGIKSALCYYSPLFPLYHLLLSLQLYSLLAARKTSDTEIYLSLFPSNPHIHVSPIGEKMENRLRANAATRVGVHLRQKTKNGTFIPILYILYHSLLERSRTCMACIRRLTYLYDNYDFTTLW